MKKSFLVILIILFSISLQAKVGINGGFYIISQADYEKRVLDGKDVAARRYIVVPFCDKHYKDIFVTKDEKALLSKFSYLLLKGKTKSLDKYIANCDTTLEINNFIKGLYHFSNMQYSIALTYFEKKGNRDFEFWKQLLIADCKYELLNDKKKYKPVLELYQKALDMSNDPINKGIVNNRIKYLKYN